MKKQFEWRELSEDGLLKMVPEGTARYGYRESLGGPWDTEEEAFAALTKFAEKCLPSYCSNDFVLVTIYRVGR